jgi:serine/threonine-protein kinase
MTEQIPLYPGKTLGRYELILPLAAGATASVWAARLTGSRIEKIVAVKAMLTEFLDDAEAESMFLDEAQLLARIRHPNVASVLDFGEEPDALYIVMEWVDGEPLQVVAREARQKGGVPLPIAARIAKQTALGLHAAHELRDESGKLVGLVHRDVSPQNILVGYDGAVRVIDFGVAKAESNMQRTTVGQLKGKVPYMAPEQAMGAPVDRRTDVFALGIVLYQLITGKHPFRGDNEFQTLVRIRDPSPAPSPRTLVPDLPAPLEALIMKALSKLPGGRFANMVDFTRALEAALPAPPDDQHALSTFMGSVCANRAGKKAQAIREAMRAAAGGGPRPTAVKVTSLFDDFGDESSAPKVPESSAPRAVPAAPVSAPAAPVSVPSAPVSVPKAPVSAPAAAVSAPAAPVSAPAAPVSAPAAPVSAPVSAPAATLEPAPDAIPNFGAPSKRTKLIAVGIAVAVVAILLAVWSAATAPSNPPPGGTADAPRRSW